LDRWQVILIIWYMWISASAILMIYKGVSYQFVYSLALVYMAIPTFVYMVFYAKKRYQARTEKINNTSER